MDWTLCSACLTLCDPTDCSPPGSSVHGILQARTLAWVAVHVSRGSSWPRDRTRVSSVFCIGKWILYHWCHLGSPQHSIIAISARLKWKKNRRGLILTGYQICPFTFPRIYLPQANQNFPIQAQQWSSDHLFKSSLIHTLDVTVAVLPHPFWVTESKAIKYLWMPWQ